MTRNADPRQLVDCPYPGCYAVLRIPQYMPAGEYKCICWACTVRVAWATSVSGERTAYVEAVEVAENGHDQ